MKNNSKITRTFRELALNGSELIYAPWNPRTADELAEDHPDMKKLVASVKARGVLQPIAVWESYVIAGCRRFAAAKVAGLNTIPAVVFEGLKPPGFIERTNNANDKH